MGHDRHFLFLQGPHGPFFYQLGRKLRRRGAGVTRVGFNAGDRASWPERRSFVSFTAPHEAWPDTLDALITERGITDIVLYGDTRPIHAQALAIARAKRLTSHIFEEGYVRPYWATYEREGANGHSALMQMSVAEMASRQEQCGMDMDPPPALWGDMREHLIYGAVYHGLVLAGGLAYRNFRTHREHSISAEAQTYLRKLVSLPSQIVRRRFITSSILRGPHPYHLALLQLDHDANFRMHSPFKDTPDFIRAVVDGFASGAPADHHLVIKAHPLESGRKPLRQITQSIARAAGLEGRVHYVPGGKLAPLLHGARSAVTVNSTAGQQALLHGIPLKVFGDAVYAKRELVSDQPLDAFFARPRPPEPGAYDTYRRFLQSTSQLSGGFYARRSRGQLLEAAVEAMLRQEGPYDKSIHSDALNPVAFVQDRC